MEARDALLLTATCVGQFLALHACGTLLFDLLHTFAHVLPRKNLISRWHHFHHKFQGANLKICDQFEAENLTNHLVPEWITSLVPAALVAAYAAPLGWAQLTALTFLVVRSIVFIVAGLIMKGRDSNHVELERVKVCKNWVLVGPHYHALHHVFPGQYMSSFVKVLDYILGTAAPRPAGRTFVITGAGGALGTAFAARLRAAGATVHTLKHGRCAACVKSLLALLPLHLHASAPPIPKFPARALFGPFTLENALDVLLAGLECGGYDFSGRGL
jgi:hypothetical protein